MPRSLLTIAAVLALCASSVVADDPHATHAQHAPAPAKPAAKSAPKPKPAAAKPAGEAKPTAKAAPAAAEPTTPDEVLRWLTEGNARWVGGTSVDPNTSDTRRADVAQNGQKPRAMILTCADSRVPAERLFDRGVGDLFVVRVAGNVSGPHEAGSLEYGAEHLNIPLLVVMGHTKCGAVAAACEHAKAEGNVPSLIEAIAPAVARAEKMSPEAKGAEAKAQLLGTAVQENVWQSITDLLRSSEVCRRRVGSGKLKIVGAVYDIATGEARFLGEHPWQSELISAFGSPGAAEEKPAAPELASKPDEHADEPAPAQEHAAEEKPARASKPAAKKTEQHGSEH